MKILQALALSLLVTCAAAQELLPEIDDLVLVPRSEVARVNEVMSDMRKSNETLMREVIDLQRERLYLKSKLGCA